jgi:negative regulator of replication initiation
MRFIMASSASDIGPSATDILGEQLLDTAELHPATPVPADDCCN